MNLEYKDRYVQAMRDFHYLPQQTFSLSNVLINADFDFECVEIGLRKVTTNRYCIMVLIPVHWLLGYLSSMTTEFQKTI